MLLAGCRDHNPPAAGPSAPAASVTQRVDINGAVFELELALTDAQRFAGLSHRSQIADSGGMLFVFPIPGVHNFVMRQCLVPIDVVFLNPAGRIIAMHEMKVEPAGTDEDDLTSYSSRYPTQFVLEFKAGTIRRLGLKEDQLIELPFAALKARAK